MCGSNPLAPKQPRGMTYKGVQYSGSQVKDAEMRSQQYNAVMLQRRIRAKQQGKTYKAPPIKDTKFYPQALRDATPAATPQAEDESGRVLRTGSDLGKAKLRNKRGVPTIRA